MKSVLDPPTYCPDVHGMNEAYTALGFDGCYIWNNEARWGYYGVESKFTTDDLCPADGDGKCYKKDPRDPTGTARPVCCPLEEVQIPEGVAPWCDKVLDMGADVISGIVVGRTGSSWKTAVLSD